MKRLVVFLGGAFAILVACGGSSSNAPATTAGSPTCAMRFFTEKQDARCQQALDSACCAQEKACASTSGCQDVIACFRTCPDRRSHDCEVKCAPAGKSTPGVNQFEDLSLCGKGNLPADAHCSWE